MVVAYPIEKIVKEQEDIVMENNENNEVVKTTQSEPVDTQKPTDTIDYKAEYEKMKKLKDQYSKESADWKTKYNSTLSDVEKERIANEEREAHYKQIEREYNLGKISNGLSKNISDDKVVGKIAEKLLDGDNFGAVSELNTYLASYKDIILKQAKEELLKDNPTPPPTNTNNNGGVSKKDFDKMSYAERVAFKEKNPETYKKYTE